MAASNEILRDPSKMFLSSDVKSKTFFPWLFTSSPRIPWKVEPSSLFWSPASTPAPIWRWNGKILTPADVQYNIDDGCQYGRWAPFALRKRWSSGTPSARTFGHLEVCEATAGLVSINLALLYERRRLSVLHICILHGLRRPTNYEFCNAVGRTATKLSLLAKVNINVGCLKTSLLGRIHGGRRKDSAHHGSDAWGMFGLVCFRKAAFCDCINGKLRHCNPTWCKIVHVLWHMFYFEIVPTNVSF